MASGFVVFVAIFAFAVSGAYAATGTSKHGGTAAPEPTATPTATPAPKKKAKKVTVRQIQRALGIKADGKLGPKTKRAIKRFQKRNGLKADGIAGPATLRALGLLPQPRVFDAVPPTGEIAEVLAKIAECESGGNPKAVSADGRFRGKYQFSQATWEALGGEGDPIDADESVQDALAARLYEERGAAPWPSCSKVLAENDED